MVTSRLHPSGTLFDAVVLKSVLPMHKYVVLQEKRLGLGLSADPSAGDRAHQKCGYLANLDSVHACAIEKHRLMH